MDPDEKAVSDTAQYATSQGVVDTEGIQSAVLTIKTTKLADFADQESFTYKCSAKSSQYADSPAAPDVDVVAHVLKLGMFCGVEHS